MKNIFTSDIYAGGAHPVEESDIEEAITTKQDVITGAATTITDNNLTANRSLTSNSNGKVDVATTTTTELNYVHGVTSAIQTQLNAKASTSLDNLSSAGQMIIDSANGTISNCILEIPQNIKASIASNVITLAGGSILTLTGSTYATYTTTADITRDIASDNLSDGKYIVFASHATIHQPRLLSDVTSGSAFPTENLSNLSVFYNTTDKKIYQYLTNSSEWVNFTDYYPICLIEVSSGVASFAKDDAGNDIIFNDYCIIGHHHVGYPNPKLALGCNGFDANGKLENYLIRRNAVLIYELPSTAASFILRDNGSLRGGGYSYSSEQPYKIVNSVPTSFVATTIYDKGTNNIYRWSSGGAEYQRQPKSIYYGYIRLNSNGVLQNLLILKPYEGARCLLTDEIEEEVATKQADVTTLTGYDATKTQTLKNVSGVLTWVDDE